MTGQTTDPAEHAGVFISAQADEIAGVPYAIDRLNLAATAMRLAIDAADRVPDQIRDRQLRPATLFENWQAANLLVSQAFSRLSFEVCNAVAAMKLMLPRHED
jgi:hypothetical protein